MAILQNLVGIGLVKALGINELLGIMAGAVSLEGGHGAAAAFGPTAEEHGAQCATAVAIAAATFGLIDRLLIGSPLATWLIKRNNLAPETRDIGEFEERGVDNTSDVSEGTCQCKRYTDNLHGRPDHFFVHRPSGFDRFIVESKAHRQAIGTRMRGNLQLG